MPPRFEKPHQRNSSFRPFVVPYESREIADGIGTNFTITVSEQVELLSYNHGESQTVYIDIPLPIVGEKVNLEGILSVFERYRYSPYNELPLAYRALKCFAKHPPVSLIDIMIDATHITIGLGDSRELPALSAIGASIIQRNPMKLSDFFALSSLVRFEERIPTKNYGYVFGQSALSDMTHATIDR